MHKIAVVEILTGIHDVLIVFFFFRLQFQLIYFSIYRTVEFIVISIHCICNHNGNQVFFSSLLYKKRNLILHIYSLFHTYFFTGIFPVLSACRHNLVCALSKKSVAEPFNWLKLYANFIISSVQC